MANYMYKSGEIDWSDPSLENTKKTAGGNDYLRLAPGSNIVRILTLPHQYMQHRFMPENSPKKYGYRVNCCKRKEGDFCPLCDKGDKPKRRWLLGVIDRKTGLYKILDIGYSVFKDIQTLQKDPEWGNPDRFDIDLVVDPNGGATGYYTPVPKPPKPLSVADLVLKDDHASDLLVRRTEPPTLEKMQEKLQRIYDECGSSPDGNSNSSQTDDNEEDDNENFFKSYDQHKKLA